MKSMICAGSRIAAWIGRSPAVLGAVDPLAIGSCDADSVRPVVSRCYWIVTPAGEEPIETP
jgi:hypothetical protein